MQVLLAPFSPSSEEESTGSGAGVQENLVTRNGEVEAELQRMRMLLVRVAGRVGMLREKGSRIGGRDGEGDEMEVDDEDGDVDVEMDEQRKVGMLLDKF